MKKKELLAAFVLLLYGSHDALGQKVVTAYEGDEFVSLPFIMPQPLKKSPSLQWRRGSEEVHQRRNLTDDFRKQSSVFKDRTRMNPGAFQTGNLTLVLNKPTISDTGSYTCVVKEDGKEVGRTTVALSVVKRKDSPAPVGSIVGGVIGAVLVLLVTVPVVLWLVWKKNLSSKVEKVTVDDGDDSVSLPFHIPMSLLSSKSSVEWRRGTETVHLRVKQRDVLSGQSDEFKARTQMNKDALETGDLTLTLLNPRVSDSGIYSCVVKKGWIEVGRFSVNLKVKGEQVTVYEGDDSVSLPFLITMSPELSGLMSSVEWKREGPPFERVHLREGQRDVFRGQSDEFKDRTEMKPDALKTGDFTLVLKDPRVSDWGTYSCEVKEGSTVVRDISVFLRVKRIIETVFEGDYSVSLPVHIRRSLLSSESSVEWKREGPPSQTVHLTEEQKDDLSEQSDEFKDRTEMNPDALKTGDLTLVLKYPRVSDRGTYICLVKEGSTVVRRTTVFLRVRVKQVTVDDGDDSVSLPFYIPMSLLSSKSSVEWRRGTETVHLIRQQGDVLSGQSDEFQDRTEMNADALETGDLTLTLKYPRDSDSGTYSCVVKEEDDDSTEVRHISVELRVKGIIVTVYDEDDSVSLPFHIRRSLPSSQALVEWRRESETVHLRKQQGDDLSGQSDKFTGRTEMKQDALRTGNLTLILKDPRVSDRGFYSCVVKEGSTVVRHTSVELRVKGIKVTVYDGDDSVSLPFLITMSLLSSESSVEWRQEGPPSETVHLREEQGDVLSGQSNNFKGRTKMKPDALKTGNLTLVLKDPRVSDSGTYSCVVKEGSTEVRRTSVELRVYMEQVTVDEGDDSVMLKYRIQKFLLSSQSSVEWRRGTETVHLREEQGDVLSGQSDNFKDRTEMKPDALKTGDLTLFLKDPRFSDNGTYSCVVKKGSTVVRHISVELRVRATPMTEPVPDPQSPLLSGAQTEKLQLSGAAVKNSSEETWVQMKPLLDRNNSAPGDNSVL